MTVLQGEERTHTDMEGETTEDPRAGCRGHKPENAGCHPKLREAGRVLHDPWEHSSKCWLLVDSHLTSQLGDFKKSSYHRVVF